MSKQHTTAARLSDYSLVGKDTPLALQQGLVEAKWYASPIAKAQMRELLKRRDGPAIRDTLLWFALLFAFGYGGYLLWGTAWTIIPFAIYGVLYASVSDSRWHESSHGTAFKTDWMNNALYEVASFMVRRESVPWRWSHTRHHSDTTIVGWDPEIAVPRPANLQDVALKFLNLKAVAAYVRTVAVHCTGKITPQERTYIPESEFGKVFIRARLYVLIYAGVIALSIFTRSFIPLMLFVLPNFYGTWLTVIYGLTQHAGLAENVLDHRLNTRTVYMNWINRYLYWNMGYHIEHHMFPLVPYHALPKLHELIKADMPTPFNGLLEAYREIIPALLRQSKDHTYYVQRVLPPSAQPSDTPRITEAITSQAKPDAEGWLDVCDLDKLLPGEPVRFEHEANTYAIYRTSIGQLFASDGRCTHGNGQLTDGFLQGTCIECPKHNGRFDVRDGSVRRPPPRVALKTYPVRHKGGKVQLKVAG